MKRLLLLTFVITTCLSINCYAGNNSAAEAFATGFANAMNVQRGGRPYQPPAQVQANVQVYQAPAILRNEVVALRQDGSEGARFSDFRACYTFVQNTFGFASCQSVSVAY